MRLVEGPGRWTRRQDCRRKDLERADLERQEVFEEERQDLKRSERGCRAARNDNVSSDSASRRRLNAPEREVSDDLRRDEAPANEERPGSRPSLCVGRSTDPLKAVVCPTNDRLGGNATGVGEDGPEAYRRGQKMYICREREGQTLEAFGQKVVLAVAHQRRLICETSRQSANLSFVWNEKGRTYS